VEGLAGVSAEVPEPASRDDTLGTLVAEPGRLFAGPGPGPSGRDADLEAGESVGSFPFPPITLDTFALSSFICTSVVLGFELSVFDLAFFSLASLDVTPRFASGFDDDEGALGAVPFEAELALGVPACGAGEAVPVVL
jgi:hypothetical protein